MSLRHLATLALLSLSACSEKSNPAHAPQGLSPTAARAEADEVFVNRCSLCHGMAGKGDGPAASGLNPPPRNFADAAWQTQITDEQIEKIVRGGGQATGKSVAMPANPDLDARVIIALRIKVRSLADSAQKAPARKQP